MKPTYFKSNFFLPNRLVWKTPTKRRETPPTEAEKARIIADEEKNRWRTEAKQYTTKETAYRALGKIELEAESAKDKEKKETLTRKLAFFEAIFKKKFKKAKEQTAKEQAAKEAKGIEGAKVVGDKITVTKGEKSGEVIDKRTRKKTGTLRAKVTSSPAFVRLVNDVIGPKLEESDIQTKIAEYLNAPDFDSLNWKERRVRFVTDVLGGTAAQAGRYTMAMQQYLKKEKKLYKKRVDGKIGEGTISALNQLAGVSPSSGPSTTVAKKTRAEKQQEKIDNMDRKELVKEVRAWLNQINDQFDKYIQLSGEKEPKKNYSIEINGVMCRRYDVDGEVAMIRDTDLDQAKEYAKEMFSELMAINTSVYDMEDEELAKRYGKAVENADWRKLKQEYTKAVKKYREKGELYKQYGGNENTVKELAGWKAGKYFADFPTYGSKDYDKSYWQNSRVRTYVVKIRQRTATLDKGIAQIEKEGEKAIDSLTNGVYAKGLRELRKLHANYRKEFEKASPQKRLDMASEFNEKAIDLLARMELIRNEFEDQFPHLTDYFNNKSTKLDSAISRAGETIAIYEDVPPESVPQVFENKGTKMAKLGVESNYAKAQIGVIKGVYEPYLADCKKLKTSKNYKNAAKLAAVTSGPIKTAYDRYVAKNKESNQKWTESKNETKLTEKTILEEEAREIAKERDTLIPTIEEAIKKQRDAKIAKFKAFIKNHDLPADYTLANSKQVKSKYKGNIPSGYTFAKVIDLIVNKRSRTKQFNTFADMLKGVLGRGREKLEEVATSFIGNNHDKELAIFNSAIFLKNMEKFEKEDYLSA